MDENKEFKLEPGLFDKNASPFKEIISGKDVNDVIISLNDEQKIELSNVFRLKINIKSIGSLFYLLPSEGFDKNIIFEKISPLKEIEIKDNESAKEKVNRVKEILLDNKPLLILYVGEGEYFLSKEDIDSLDFSCPVFYFKEETPVVEETQKEEENPTEATSFKDKCKLFIKKLSKFFEPVKVNGFYYLFAILAAFLIEFTISIGAFTSYSGKMICIFFFICSVIGGILNYFVTTDILKKYPIKSRGSIFLVCSSLIGLALGTVGTLIYLSLQKEMPEALITVGPIYGIGIGAAIGVIAISDLTSYLIKRFKK